MTDLRRRMQEDLQLRGLAPKTQEAYVDAVRQLAKHYEKPPDQISEEELRQYFLHLKNEKKASRSTCTIALCGIKFFYEQTLGQEWARLDFVRPAREKKLPVVLSSGEGRPEVGGRSAGEGRPEVGGRSAGLCAAVSLPSLFEHDLCVRIAFG